MSATSSLQSIEAKSESSPRRVLVAEDDAVFRRILQSWLRKWGYEVIVTENGTDAWEALQREDAPSLLILDWMMPGMDGPEVCQRVRACQAGPYRYVLLLTARAEKHDTVAGLEAGADDYLTKPFDISELRVRLNVGCRILDLEEGLVRAQVELQHRATHDALTGVLNRGAVLQGLAEELAHNVARGGRLGVLIVDIDHFKRVNDTYGHLTGDAVLRGVTERLQANMRSNDALGRYGGEEFLVLAPRCDLPGLVAYAERLRVAVAEAPIATASGPVQVTISMGASAMQAENFPATPDEVLKPADEALYRAKAGGRNRVEVAELGKCIQAASAAASSAR